MVSILDAPLGAIDFSAIRGMPPWLIVCQVAAGLLAGLSTAWLYFLVLKRQAEALASGTPSALAVLGYLIRLILVGGSVAATTYWGIPAGIACAVAFIAAQRLAIASVRKSLARARAEALEDAGDDEL